MGITGIRIPDLFIGHFVVILDSQGGSFSFCDAKKLSVYEVSLYEMQGNIKVEVLILFVPLGEHICEVDSVAAMLGNSIISCRVRLPVSFLLGGRGDATIYMLLSGVAFNPGYAYGLMPFGLGRKVKVLPKVAIR
jgi:hypothetical protein